MKKGKWLILLGVILLAAGILLYHFFWKNRTSQSTNLAVSGNIEVTTVEVAFKIPGKIDQLLVNEGDFVKKGQLIATLEHRDLLAQKDQAQAALETSKSRIPSLLKNIDLQDQSTSQEIGQAEAAVKAAQARLQELLSGSRSQEINAAKAALDQAAADLELRKGDMERARSLFEKQYISAQEWDSARTAYEVAMANYARGRENYALVVEGPRPEEILQARAQLEQTQAALRLATTKKIQVEVLKKELETAQAQVQESASALKVIQSQLEYCNLYAPTPGVVLVKNTEPGEYIVPGGAVITLGDIEKPWLKAFIHETDLGKVKLGQDVFVTTDSFPGKVYPGKVTFVSSEAEFTPKNVQTVKERVKLVYRIKVSLDNPQHELKPGMPADAQIHLKNL